ncbi:MAG: hypothetical protein Q9168_006770 [Polycauliona sp. 1 TL-2023]
MRHSSIPLFSVLLTCANALPTSPSSPFSRPSTGGGEISSARLSTRQNCQPTPDSPDAICNYPSIPASIICSTSASTTHYAKFTIQQTTQLSAGDVLDNTDKSKFVFSLNDEMGLTVARADPLFPPTFAAGCDPSKLYWSPMVGLGNSRIPFPVDIGVFNAEGEGLERTTTFCGVMTNSHQVGEGKNQYRICNAG